VINRVEHSLSEGVLELTKGMGASLYLEATGLPTVVYPEIEKTKSPFRWLQKGLYSYT
jgi:(R,R)-butanediol dehydrogenase/meso-butanediol dehydrogenase/diacetyl reductase